MDFLTHDHQHAPNRFGVIPTPVRLNADPVYTGKGVTNEMEILKAYLKIKKAFRRRLLRSLQPCRQMVPLMSESMDRPLGPWESLQLKLHLYVCTWCARYLQQIKMFRQLLRHED